MCPEAVHATSGISRLQSLRKQKEFYPLDDQKRVVAIRETYHSNWHGSEFSNQASHYPFPRLPTPQHTMHQQRLDLFQSLVSLISPACERMVQKGLKPLHRKAW